MLGYCWNVSIFAFDKLADIQQLALSMMQTQPVTVHGIMSFLCKANFCTTGQSQLWKLCHVIQSDMLTVYHSLAHLFSPVHFSFSALCQLEQLSHLKQSPVPLQFPLPDVVVATNTMSTHWAFYFQGSGLPLSVSGSWTGSMCRAHIALQELQTITMMYKEWLSPCLVGWLLCIWITELQQLTCVIKVVQCLLFLPGWSARYWVWLTQYYSYSSIHSYPSLCGGWLNLSWGQLLLEWHLLPQMAQAAFHLWGLPEVDLLAYSCTTQPSLDISGKICVSSSCISFSSSVQVSGRTCQRSTQTFDSGGTTLDGGSLASHSS